MKIKYELTDEDIYQVNLFTHWTDPAKTGYRILVIMLPFILLTLFISYNLWNTGLLHKPIVIKNLCLLAVFTLVVCYYIIPKVVKSNIQSKVAKYLEANRHLKLTKTKEVEFDDSGIKQEGDPIAVSYTWQSIIKVKETQEFLLLYVASDSILPFKKASFTAVQLQELKMLLNAKIQV